MARYDFFWLLLFLWFLALPAAADSIQVKDVALRADVLTLDYAGRTIEGTGNVVLESADHRLTSDKITYNEKTGEITASGQVVLVDKKQNTTLKTDHVVLDGAFRSVTLEKMQLLFQDRGTLTAASGTRRSGKDHDLKDASFTPCKVCAGESPLWSVAADEVKHDTESKVIRYYNAYFQIFDVPIFYLPYYEQDDPTVKRSSGFLRGSLEQRAEEGLLIRAPYYYTMAPNQDVTVTPIWTQNGGEILGLEHRYLGETFGVTSSGSAGNVNQVQDSTLLDNKNTAGHIDSALNWQPAPFWQVDGDLERASRKGYLRQFDFDQRDILSSGARTLYHDGPTTFVTDARTYQDLRPVEDSDTVPWVLPDTSLSHFWQPPEWAKGALNSGISGRVLERDKGNDNQRASLLNTWQRQFFASDGSVFETSALLRQDVFHRDVFSKELNTTTETDTKTRFLPALQAGYKKPFYKSGESGFHQLSPVTQVVFIPTNVNSDKIDNEDSQAFELDADNLFLVNRPTGYDLTSEGSRVDYGGTYAYQGDIYLADLFLGQSFQFDEPSTQDLLAGGEGKHFSDPVARWQLSFPGLFSFDHSVRLHENDGRIARSMANLSTEFGGFTTSLTHFLLDRDQDIDQETPEKREEISGTLGIPLTEQWVWSNTAIRDLEKDENRLAQTQLTYTMDCARFSLEYRKDYTNDPNATAGNSVMFRIDLIGAP
jgi:LPS-assembly protein